MSTLRISDAPLLPNVEGTEKIPTGGRGDYAISVDQIKDHIFQDVGKELVGLGSVDNTSDLDKPVSTAQQAALNLKADKTYVDTNLDLKADKTSVYTRSETTLALSQKADLVNGVIPENQIPSSFNDVLEFTTPNLPMVGESGKIYVTTDTNKTWRWGGNKYVEISGWNPDSVSKVVTLPTYYTKEAGVDPITGVSDGAYFNVRSADDSTVATEYQNVGGSAVATGKSYPSGSYVETISEYTSLPFKQGKSYALYERVRLDNGDVVKSTVVGNTANPNVDMTGWVLETAKVVLSNYTMLREYKGGGITVEVVGVGIAGHFVLDANDTTSADNGGTIIVDILGRRWKRNSPLGYYDVTWFGAVAGWSVDNTDAIQRAFDASRTQSATITGGIVKFPRGNYVISDTIRVRTNSNEKLASVTIVGDGMQNTTLYWNTSEVTDKDVLVFEEINYCGMQDICVQGNKKARHGVVFRSTRTNCQLVIDRVQSRDVLGSCYDFLGQFMTTIRHCRAKNGGDGYRFRGNHTSCYFENAYALDNASSGFYIESMTYSVFNACASDSNLYGYRMNNINGVVMNGCGAEYNKQSGWYLVASAELDATFTYKGLSMQLNNCVGYDNDRSLSGYGTLRVEQRNTSYVSLTVNQFYEIMVNGSVSVYTAGSYTNCTVDLNKCSFTKAIYGPNGSQGVFSNPLSTFKKSATFTSLTPENIFSLSSGASNTNTYSAMLFVRAAPLRPASTLYTVNTATYLLMVTKTPASTDVSVKLISQDGMTSGAGTSYPSFTFSGQSNNLVATPVGSTVGEFFFDVYSLGQINLV